MQACKIAKGHASQQRKCPTGIVEGMQQSAATTTMPKTALERRTLGAEPTETELEPSSKKKRNRRRNVAAVEGGAGDVAVQSSTAEIEPAALLQDKYV